MIQGDHNHVSTLAQILAIVRPELLARTSHKTAPVKPDHHGTLFIVVNARRPDIDAQTILALDSVVPRKHPGLFVVGPTRARPLRGHMLVLQGTAQSDPGCRLCGWHKTRFPVGWGPVGNAFEGIDAVPRVAMSFACRSLYDGILIRCHDGIAIHRWHSASARKADRKS